MAPPIENLEGRVWRERRAEISGSLDRTDAPLQNGVFPVATPKPSSPIHFGMDLGDEEGGMPWRFAEPALEAIPG